MKRNRITYKVVMDVPASLTDIEAWKKYVLIGGGEHVTLKSVNALSSEALPDELLPWQHRKAERLAIRNLIAALIEKMDLPLIVTVRTFREGYWTQPDKAALLMEVSPSARARYIPSASLSASFKVMESEIFAMTGRNGYGNAGKKIGTLADPDLKDFAAVIEHKFGKLRKKT